MTTVPAPLDRYRILDLTHVLAGPFATHQLGMLGAEVIKIESPCKPDMMRGEGPVYELAQAGMGLHYQAQATGKKSITLDLTQATGQSLFKSLVKTSDVVVSNYRVSSQRKLGLSTVSLRESNPTVIVCSITGFGQTGPKSEHPAYDNVIQAFSGLMAATGHPGQDACKVGPPVLDYGTGAQAALAITAALLQREKYGVAAELDIAMLDAALMLMTATVTETAANGVAPQPHGNSSPVKPGYGCYKTKSGLLMIGAFTVAQLTSLFTALDRSDLAESIAQKTPHEIDNACQEYRNLIQEYFLDKDADYWEEKLNEANVPAARVRTLEESLGHPQVQSRDVLQGVEADCRWNGSHASPLYPVNAWRSDVAGGNLISPAPEPGRDNAEIFKSLGVTSDGLQTLRQEAVI